MSMTRRQFLSERLATILGDAASARVLAEQLNALVDLLEESDAAAAEAISRTRTGRTAGFVAGVTGEWAAVLYQMKHGSLLQPGALKTVSEAGRRVWAALEETVRTYCNPRVTQRDYDWAAAQSVDIVGSDGTIVGFRQYEAFDSGWWIDVLDYVLNRLDPSRVRPFTPGRPGASPYVRPLEMTGGSVRMALIGDWGTGPYDAGGYEPSREVLKTLMEVQPDYVIHLGDVYYSGEVAEEENKLVHWWPQLPPERSFTLNSNHEMYAGARGYFDRTLGRAGAATPFLHQQGSSYFALTSPAVTIVGLDSAYFDPSAMYMKGGLGDAKVNPQCQFLSDIAAGTRHVVLLTHQPPMSVDGVSTGPLWRDVSRAIRSEQIAL